jgi:AdoMet-dependent heme synthase
MKVFMDSTGYEFNFQLVQVEVTGKCNMFCKHCRASDESNINMAFDVFKTAILFGLSEKDDALFRVTLSGGEPFLHPELPRFLVFLKENGIEDIIITTNGSIHRKDILQQIKSLRFNNLLVQISVDFPDEEKHDQFRGFKGAYKRAMEMFDIIREFGIHCSMKSTITIESISCMEQLVLLAKSKGAMRIGFGTVIPTGRGTNQSLLMSADDKKMFIKEVDRLKRKYPELDVTSEDPLKVALEEGYWSCSEYEINDKTIFGGCSAGITSINVSSCGTITPCSVFLEQIVNINGKTTEQIKNIYSNSPVIKDLAKREFNGKCGRCNLKMLCGGCRAIPYGTSGNYLGDDLTCWKMN